MPTPTHPKAARFLFSAILALLINGCSVLPHYGSRLPGNHAFVVYWPPPEDSGELRLAVKDNIDMKGVVTTAGSRFFAKTHQPAEKDAPCLAIARERNVRIVGKTSLTEFAVSPSGFNEDFGTPKNPFDGWRRLIPGGSSSGSAVAVATGMADVAFGTDTAGSIRVPAACCGIVGLKTTHGLVPIDGVHPIEPAHLDTVGPMARDIAGTVKGMDLLQRGFESKYNAAVVAQPAGGSIRVGRLTLAGTDPKVDQAVDRALTAAGFQVIPLDPAMSEKFQQAKDNGNTVAATGAWISDQQYLYAPGVSPRTKSAILAGRIMQGEAYQQALAKRPEWQAALRQTFNKVDFIALPTLQGTPLFIPPNLKVGLLEARMLKFQNTVAVNFAGNPALALPVPLKDSSLPVTSLQLIGPPLSEARLLNAGRLVEAAVKKEPASS